MPGEGAVGRHHARDTDGVFDKTDEPFVAGKVVEVASVGRNDKSNAIKDFDKPGNRRQKRGVEGVNDLRLKLFDRRKGGIDVACVDAGKLNAVHLLIFLGLRKLRIAHKDAGLGRFNNVLFDAVKLSLFRRNNGYSMAVFDHFL